jgi:hypothetical protein
MASSGISETVLKISIAKLGEIGESLSAIKVPPDGSCFFHSVLRSFHREYIQSTTAENRKLLCRRLRDTVAETLEEKNVTTKKTEYETLGGGYYSEFNEAVKDEIGDKYSLAALQQELFSDNPVDHVYIEILSNHLNLDIYLISSKTGDVYLTGSHTSLLYKGRRSIVILYHPGHYDIIGIRRPDAGDGQVIFDCLFGNNHQLIQAINSRITELLKEDKN